MADRPYRHSWHTVAIPDGKAPESGMATTVQLAAIAAALYGFACLLMGDWKQALAMGVLFVVLELVWKRLRTSPR